MNGRIKTISLSLERERERERVREKRGRQGPNESVVIVM